MKRVCGSLFFGVLTMLVCAAYSSASEQQVGSIRELRGTAGIIRSGSTIGARKNDGLFRTDVVKTFDKSRAKLVFIDDSLLMIGEKSTVRISEHFRDNKNISVFNLIDGVVNVIVGKSGFEVRTPTAVTAARGTSYLVWVDGSKTGLAVTEGHVDFSAAGAPPDKKEVIPAGRTSVVEIGKPPVVAVRTHQDLIKKYYEDTLDPEERWMPVLLKATGSGVPPPNAVNAAQARLMALRAAKVDAMRNLLEQSYGVSIVSESKIRDFVAKSDNIRARVDAFIKGAWISEERDLADGTVEVDMEIGLGIGFRRMFLEQSDKR
ncbi:MAG: FecR domain-containing protein [Nitrospiraceae bacterium]|nr:FecR domain-containing protein [Nitrospiraceae bacterium]